MKLPVEVIAGRADAAWDGKRAWYWLHSLAYEYAAPGMDPFTGGMDPGAGMNRSKGQPLSQHLYDGTLVRDSEELAAELVSEIMPAGQRWAKMSAGAFFGQGALTEAQRDGELMSIERRVFEAIHASNWQMVAHAMAIDAVVTGTGVAQVGVAADAKTYLQFEAVSQAEVALEAGPRAEVWGVYRKLWLTRMQIEAKWPDADMLPDDDEDAARPSHHTVIEATYYDPQDGLWRYSVLRGEAASSGGGAIEMVERAYVISPWIVWRYALRPGEVQGRGPVFAALWDALTLNHAIRIRLESASIRAVPVFTAVDDGVFNADTADFAPGSILPVASNDPQAPSLRALDLAGDPQMNELTITDLRQQIDRALLRGELPPLTGPVHSPTEIVARERRAMRALGQPYMRMQEEVCRPMLRSVAYLLAEAGDLPELEAMMPETVATEAGPGAPLRLDGTDISLAFSSPQETAQKLADAEKVMRFSEMSQVSAGPNAYQAAVKTEKIPSVYEEIMGLEAYGLIRDENEQQGMMATREQMLMGQPEQPLPTQP